MNKEKIALEKNLKLVAGSALFIFVALVGSKILGYAYRVIIARNFGPEAYGLFSLTLMLSSLFVALSLLGLNQGILRYVAFYRGKNETNKINFIFNLTKRIYLFSGVFAGIVFFFLSDVISINVFHNEGLIPFMQIFSLVIIFSVISNAFLVTLRAYEKIKWHSFLSFVFHNVISLILILIFIIVGFQNNAIAISYMLGALVVFGISYFVIRIKLPFLFQEYSLSDKKKKQIKKVFCHFSTCLL